MQSPSEITPTSMKYSINIYLLVFLVSIHFVSAQDCLPGGISLSSQAEINNFSSNYPGCTRVIGHVLIQSPSSDITSLVGLSQLTYIGADLVIKEQSLISLAGLENLDTIAAMLTIEGNEVLLGIDALTNLEKVDALRIRDNDQIRNLNAFAELSSSFSSIEISDNDRLGTCDCALICTYGSRSSVIISDNAYGCDSKSELEMRCSGAGCPDVSSHNYNPSALSSSSCETCDDNILNGDETEIDCGGLLCVPCICEDSVFISLEIVDRSRQYRARKFLEFDEVDFLLPYEYIMKAPEIVMEGTSLVELGASAMMMIDSACPDCLFSIDTIGSPIVGENIGDYSGNSISYSSAGDRVIIGSPRNDDGGNIAGQARIYEWSGTTWNQLGADIEGDQMSVRLGTAVSMDASGNRVAVGGPYATYSGDQVGEVRVYEWDGTSWNQLGPTFIGPQDLAQFGEALDLNDTGNRLIIGASTYDAPLTRAGLARTYEWNGTLWTLMGADITGTGFADNAGTAVSINALGDRIAVSSPRNDEGGDTAGKVDIYDWNGSNWIQLGNSLLGSESSFFGNSISLTDLGNRIAIGAKFDNTAFTTAGSAHVYEWDGTSWQLMGNSIMGDGIDDRLGFSIDISATGDRFITGAIDPTGSDNFGYAKLYEWNGSTWTQVEETITGVALDDYCGYSTTISSDGTRIAIGANRFSSIRGHVRFYEVTCD